MNAELEGLIAALRARGTDHGAELAADALEAMGAELAELRAAQNGWLLAIEVLEAERKALVERLRDPHSGTWPKLKAECASALEAMGTELLVKDAQLDALHREERALSDACVSLRLQVEALAKDAARYRWLKKSVQPCHSAMDIEYWQVRLVPDSMHLLGLDAAIDAILSRKDLSDRQQQGSMK